MEPNEIQTLRLKLVGAAEKHTKEASNAMQEADYKRAEMALRCAVDQLTIIGFLDAVFVTE
jgi:hypothetical protein